ncbi:hypothetical protein GCM10017559_78040 [Streptosporangium longisporum]|uniref:Uncharacterized protein n=1 Tax=Streptosporangium longisporum TaxID=46187 RepID=A0ABP6LDW2_9ACTN
MQADQGQAEALGAAPPEHLDELGDPGGVAEGDLTDVDHDHGGRTGLPCLVHLPAECGGVPVVELPEHPDDQRRPEQAR